MPLTWSDAVEHTAASDAAGRYHRACTQILELHTMVQSFRSAVLESGKWPWTSGLEANAGPKYKMGSVDDPYRAGVRYVLVKHRDQGWTLHDVIPMLNDYATQVAEVDGFGAVDLGGNLANVLALTDFDLRMDAIERSKDWVPLQLLGYLQQHDIPVPSDG